MLCAGTTGVKSLLKLTATRTRGGRSYTTRYERLLPIAFAAALIIVIGLIVMAALVLAGVFPAGRG